MSGPTRIRTVAQFQMGIDSDAGLVITDSANKAMFHPDPRSCMHIEEDGFKQKVIDNAERNGSYFLVPSLSAARGHWPEIRGCKTCSGSAAEGSEGDDGREPLLAALREATGLTAVRSRAEEPVGAEAMLDESTRSTQRIALGLKGGAIVLCSWPGELKPQAEALYMSDRAACLLELVSSDSRWRARPKPHLAFRSSSADQRIYFSCPLGLDEYMRRWSEAEYMDQVREHPAGTLRDGVWRWLQERGVADPEQTSEVSLDAFIERLGRRKAHLRPGVEVERVWSTADGAAMPEDAPRAGEVRIAVGELLTALREPLPPAVTRGFEEQ